MIRGRGLNKGLGLALVSAVFLLAAAGLQFEFSSGPAALQAAQIQPLDQPDTTFPPAQAEEIRRAVQSARSSLRFQTDLPDPAPAKEGRSRRPQRSFWSSSGSFLGEGTAQVLLWLALALAVGAILWSMKDMWGKEKKLKPAEEAPDPAASAAVARMDRAQAGADDLARDGDFAGAMHMLLLQSVSELRRRLKVAIAASLTSREIWYRTSLPPEGKKVFGDIIGRVEISWFGSHQPDQEDYLACRRSFETLTSVLKQKAGAD